MARLLERLWGTLRYDLLTKWLPAALPIGVALAVVPHWPDGSLAKWIVVFLAAIPSAIYLTAQEHFDLKDVAVVAFVGFAALSLLWTPDPLAGQYEVVKIAALALVFLAFRRLDLSEIGTPIAFAVGVTVLYAVFVDAMPYGGFRNENFATDFIVVALPLMFIGRLALAVPVAIGAVIYLLFGNDSLLEFVAVAGIIGIWLVWWARTPVKMGLMIFAGIGAVSLLFLLVTSGSPVIWSILDRIHLTVGTLAMWGQHPITGNGAGSFAHLWPLFNDTDVRLVPGLGYLGAQGGYTYISAAHNDLLQTLAHFGLVGFGLLAFVVLWRSQGSWWAILSLVALGVLSLGEFVFQNAGVMALALIGLAILSPVQPAFRFRFRPVFGAGAIIFGGFAVSMGAQAGQANHWFAFTNTYLDSRPVDAFLANLTAERMFPGDTRIRLQLFRSFAEGFRAGVISADPQVVDEIYAISRSAIPDDRSLLTARLVFLASAGLCADECRAILTQMRTLDSRYQGIRYLIEMVDEAEVREAAE